MRAFRALCLPHPSATASHNTHTHTRTLNKTINSRALSQKVSVYAKRLVGESDALAVEVRSLQQQVAAARRAAAQRIGDDGELERVMDVLADAAATLTGMGPGGDL